MEIEAKFSIPDRSTFQRLLEARFLGGLALGGAAVVHIHDRYLDTADGALRAQGYACRLRQEDGRTLGGLKGLGGATGAVHRREELEVELPGPASPADWPPGPARDLALALSGARPLLPLLSISQTRHTRPVLGTGGTLATLSLDDVRICHGEALLASFFEFEAELAPGQAEGELRTLADAVQEQWALVPQPHSKFERAMLFLGAHAPGEAGGERHLGPAERAAVDRLAQQPEVLARRARALQAWDDGLSRPEIAARARLSPRRVRHWLRAFRQARLGIFPPGALGAAAPETAAPSGRPVPRARRGPGLTPGDTLGQAAVKTLAFHYGRMLRNEPGTRLGQDVEALHDMRVATRRMRAALRVFEAAIDPEAGAALRKGLRRTGRALGPVRDLDVFRQKTLAYRDSLPERQRGGLDEFLDVLEARREAAREGMIAYLDRGKYARFKTNMDAIVAGDGAGEAAGSGAAVRDVAPAAVRQRLAAVRAFDREVDLPDPPPERLHALRIAAKRLRYTLEFFEEVLGPQTRDVIAEVVALQDHLGAVQDAVVAGDLLRDYLAPLPTGQAPGVEAYLAASVAELRHMVGTFAPVWQRLASAEFRRRVVGAVSAL